MYESVLYMAIRTKYCWLIIADDVINNGELLYDEAPETGLKQVRPLISSTPYYGGGYFKVIAQSKKVYDGIPTFSVPSIWEEDIVVNELAKEYFADGGEISQTLLFASRYGFVKGYAKANEKIVDIFEDWKKELYDCGKLDLFDIVNDKLEALIAYRDYSVELEKEFTCRSGCLGFILNGEESRCCGDVVPTVKIENDTVKIMSFVEV